MSVAAIKTCKAVIYAAHVVSHVSNHKSIMNHSSKNRVFGSFVFQLVFEHSARILAQEPNCHSGFAEPSGDWTGVRTTRQDRPTMWELYGCRTQACLIDNFNVKHIVPCPHVQLKVVFCNDTSVVSGGAGSDGAHAGDDDVVCSRYGSGSCRDVEFSF